MATKTAADKPSKVLGTAELCKLAVEAAIIEDTAAPATLKIGQLINDMTTPMNPSI
jgi:hypothetical protein